MAFKNCNLQFEAYITQVFTKITPPHSPAPASIFSDHGVDTVRCQIDAAEAEVDSVSFQIPNHSVLIGEVFLFYQAEMAAISI